MARSPDAKKTGPSQENLLLDYVRRLDQHKEGRKAVHLHLSQLRPFNQRDHHIRIAAENFEELIKALQGQLFVFQNSDLFFIYKIDAEPEVETAVQQVRFLFSDDPLLTEEQTNTKRFDTWYNVNHQYDQILRLAQGMVDQEAQRRAEVRARMDTRAALKAKQDRGEPLTPEILERIEQALMRADLSNLVRRQFVCAVAAKRAPEQMFSELFISIRDLRETLSPGVDLTSNRWLFQHMTHTLDRRMLAMLAKTDHISITGDISLNVNVSTLLSQEFLQFDDNIPASRRGAVVLELQHVDIFSDLGAYQFAREFVQDRGYKVCIDGLTYRTMAMIDRERLGADMMKLVWNPEMVEGGDEIRAKVKSMISLSGDSTVVLCRCDDRQSVDFGRAVGCHLFQGRHIETLIAEEGRKKDLRRLKNRIQRS